MSTFHNCQTAEEQIAELEKQIAELEKQNRAVRKLIEKHIKKQQEALKTCADDRAPIHMSALNVLIALQHDVRYNLEGEISEPK